MKMMSSWIKICSLLILGTGILCDRKLERRQAVSSCTENNDDNFRCTNGLCIEWSLVCDRHYDCSDGSDETKELCARYEYGTNINLDCGKVGEDKTVYGTPWLVSINKLEPTIQYIGMGSIIAPNVVIAMAEPFWRSDLKYKQNSVNDGGRYLYDIKVKEKPYINYAFYIKVETIYFVEDLGQYGSNENELAVIVLAVKIWFNKGVLPVCIDWYRKYNLPDYADIQIFSTTKIDEQNIVYEQNVLTGRKLHIDGSSCMHLYDSYNFTHSEKYCIRLIYEKKGNELTQYQTLNILHYGNFFLTGLKSFWSTYNQYSALGFIDIKNYVPWIRGILNKHSTVDSCILRSIEGVVYSFKNSSEILSPGTLVNPSLTVNENCEVGYHQTDLNSYRVCQSNGKWKTVSDQLCLKMCPPLLSDSLDIKCILNGKVDNCSNPSIPNTTATASCKPSYNAQNGQEDKPQVLFCQSNGKWNTQLYTCILATFCVLPTAEGVVYTYEDSFESLPQGTLINPTITVNENCEVGYHNAHPNSFRVCQRNGKWRTVSEKLCLKMCPPLLSDSLNIKCTLNGKVANCSNPSIPDTIASTSCKPSYSAPDGQEDTPQVLVCQSNGKWNKPLYACKLENPCVLPTSEGVVYTYEHSNKILPHGTLINPTITINENCEVGYFNAHPNCFRVCQKNGKWRTVSEKLCLKMCKPLISDSLDIKCTLNGKVANCSNPSIPDTIASPSCKTTHHLPNGQAETPLDIHCQPNGEWNNQLYRCEPTCGKLFIQTEPLMENGKIAMVGTAPWNVGIYKFNINNTNYDLVCGGSIISHRLVVSAAHCFWEKGISHKISVHDDFYKIAVGKYSRDLSVTDNQFTKIMNVEMVHLKEGYNGDVGHLFEDIAMILLKNRISFSDGIAPVCIDWSFKYNEVNEDQGKIVGWGRTERGIVSPILLEASLPYLNNSLCRKMFTNGFAAYVTVDKFCAGSTSVSGQRLDRGDSGAGLCFLHNNLYYLTGVASSRDPETNNSVALFTDIKYHINWIRDLYLKLV